MNLHGIVAGAISAVNPQIMLSVQVSTGNAVGSDGTPTPTYAPAVVVPGDVQAFSYKDIVQTEGLNLQGTRMKVYINGNVHGLVRATNQGGDLITISSGNYEGVWLVAMVSESWADWCSALCTLQNGS